MELSERICPVCAANGGHRPLEVMESLTAEKQPRAQYSLVCAQHGRQTQNYLSRESLDSSSSAPFITYQKRQATKYSNPKAKVHALPVDAEAD